MNPCPVLHRSKALLLCAAALLGLSACQRRDEVPTPDTTRAPQPGSTQPEFQSSAPLPSPPASPASATSAVP